MVVTLLTANAQNEPAEYEDCADWADAYNSTHPILADEAGLSWDVMLDAGYGYPFFMIIDRGAVIADMDDGDHDGEITEDDIAALL
jgi:hypothetical protein